MSMGKLFDTAFHHSSHDEFLDLVGLHRLDNRLVLVIDPTPQGQNPGKEPQSQAQKHVIICPEKER